MNKNSIFYNLDQKVDKIIKIVNSLSILEYSNTLDSISKNNLQAVFKKIQSIEKFLTKNGIPIVIEPIKKDSSVIEQSIQQLYKINWMIFGTDIETIDEKSIRVIENMLDQTIQQFKNYGVSIY